MNNHKASNGSPAPEIVTPASLGDALLNYCRNFIADQSINCAETVYQTDRVMENAAEFIHGICEIVGYAKSED